MGGSIEEDMHPDAEGTGVAVSSFQEAEGLRVDMEVVNALSEGDCVVIFLIVCREIDSKLSELAVIERGRY